MYYLRGFLAARQVPVGYFEFLGKPHLELALFLISVVVHLIPEVVALAAGVAISTFLLRGVRAENAIGFDSGAVTSYFFFLIFYRLSIQANGDLGVNWRELVQSFYGPWWAAPTILSPVVGLCIGVWMALKYNRAAPC
jgi:hypothetical protein